MVEGSCTRGSCRLFGGSTSGYLQMKGHKCGTVEESGGKEWPGEIAGMSKFILEESKGGEEIERESKSVGQKEGMVVATVVSNRQSSWWLLVVCSRIIRSPEENYCSNRSLPRH